MKYKFLILSLFMGASFAKAGDFLENERIVGAFSADEEVQTKIHDVKVQLRNVLPGCALSVENGLRGHLYSTSVNTVPPNNIKRRTYLVTQLIACSKGFPTGAIGYRRDVTAKVLVNLKKLPDGTFEETPMKVVLVDITNSDLEN